MTLLLLASFGCSRIWNPDSYRFSLPFAIETCYGNFDDAPGAIFFEAEAASGDGRGLFVAEGQAWVWTHLRSRSGTATLEIRLSTAETFEITMDAVGGGIFELRDLPGPPGRLAIRPCVDTVGLYDPLAQSFSLWNASLDIGPDEMVALAPRPADPANPQQPLAGDWDGDGTWSPGVFDPVTRTFFLSDDEALGTISVTFAFPDISGALQPDDLLLPVVGDWDSDGSDTVGLFATRSALFFLVDTLTAGAAVNQFTFGGAGMTEDILRPLAGDWNGDGQDTVGVYNQRARRMRLVNTNAAVPADVTCLLSTLPQNLLPVAGDWGNFGSDGVGLYEPLPATRLDRGFRLYTLLAPSEPERCNLVSRFAIGPRPTVDAPLVPVAGNWDGN